MIANEEFSIFIHEFRETYIELQSAFPEEVLRNQSAHSQCLKLLDWASTTGNDAFNRYKDLHSDLAVIIHEIQNNYVTQIEEHIDRSQLSNLVARAFVIATEINSLIFSDDMSYFRNIENFPYVEIQDADVEDYEYRDDQIFVLPNTFEDDDLRSCLWLSNQFVLYQAYELMSYYLKQYREKHITLKDSFQKIFSKLSSLQFHYTRLIKPDLEMITSYQNKEIEKNILQATIGGDVGVWKTDGFTSGLDTLSLSVDETVTKLQEDFASVVWFYNIPLNFSLPLYSYEIMNVTKIGRQLMKHRNYRFTGYDDREMQENFAKTFTETLEKHSIHTEESLLEMTSSLQHFNKYFVVYLTTLREELHKFKVDTTMDSAFYM